MLGMVQPPVFFGPPLPLHLLVSINLFRLKVSIGKIQVEVIIAVSLNIRGDFVINSIDPYVLTITELGVASCPFDVPQTQSDIGERQRSVMFALGALGAMTSSHCDCGAQVPVEVVAWLTGCWLALVV